jgi:transcriptional regulator with XRE-family HTH domain
MNMEAAGAYLRVLRDARGLTQGDIADQLGVSLKTVQRIEGGEGRTLATTLAAFIDIVRGSPQQVQQLIVAPNGTAEDGERVAQEWLERSGLGARIDALFEGLTDEEADAVVKAMLERDRPAPLLAAFRAWWERMRA